MEKDKQRNIFIIVLLVLAILMIGFIVWWQFFRDTVTEVEVNTNTVTNTNTQEVVIDVTNLNTNTEVNLNTDVVIEEDLSAQRLANIFAERFGSYTSESEFQNTIDLKVYMTDTLKVWADNYVASQQALDSNGVYYSIITKVISTKVISDNGEDVTIELLTQRTESGDEFEENNIYTQKLELEMKGQNDVWLVNKFTWEDK